MSAVSVTRASPRPVLVVNVIGRQLQLLASGRRVHGFRETLQAGRRVRGGGGGGRGGEREADIVVSGGGWGGDWSWHADGTVRRHRGGC